MEYPYKVSVSIITYNQREYIGKAVEGALMQEVDFPYEIIIGDDCSTDGTREILKDYKKQYPDLIKLHLHDEKGKGIAGRKNNINNIQSAKGKYIAFCDGDDYWISKDKLQRQADFMDANPEFSFCFHDALEKDTNRKKEYYLSDKQFLMRKSREVGLKEILCWAISAASGSTFYRADIIKPLPKWFWNVYLADRSLRILAGTKGKFFYFQDLKSARVETPKSVSHHLFNEKNYLNTYKNDNAILKEHFEIGTIIISPNAKFNFFKAASYFHENKILRMMKSIGRTIYYDPKMLIYESQLLFSKVRYWYISIR